MKLFTKKTCRRCEDVFTPLAPAQLYCDKCVVVVEEELKLRHRDKARLRYRRQQALLGRVLGHGKGSSNKSGKDSPCYKNGIAIFTRMKRVLRQKYTNCQWCGKDLTNASQYEWCTHHIDHDRTNNVEENLVLICKRCHQLEHNCEQAFLKGATTISKESTLKRVEAQGTDNSVMI